MPICEFFKIPELTEVMWQRRDRQFIDLLNHVRLLALNQNDLQLLTSKSIDPSKDEQPENAFHIFAENARALTHSITMFEVIHAESYNIKSNDIIPKNIPAIKINQVLRHNQSETSRLASILKIKLNAQSTLTVNIDLQDRLLMVNWVQ